MGFAMIEWKLKLWKSAGVAALAGLAACGAAPQTAKAPPEPAPSAGPSGESGAGGEQGEAGVAAAYEGLDGDPRTALRLSQLKGFVLVAARHAEGDSTADAGVLVQQGLLEAYDPFADQFGALDIAPVRAAGEAENLSRAAMSAKLQNAESAIDTARSKLSYNHADLAARLVDLSSGLYQNVNQNDVVDPTEYQHSLGAALSARDVLGEGRAALRAENARAYDEALADVNALIAQWPAIDAPEHPTPYRDVLAQASRVRLALSPFLE
jgi:hypothetical protein